jgi:hypothetical protein
VRVPAVERDAFDAALASIERVFGRSAQERDFEAEVDELLAQEPAEPMPPLVVEDAPPLTKAELAEHQRALEDEGEEGEVDPEIAAQLMPRIKWMERQSERRRKARQRVAWRRAQRDRRIIPSLVVSRSRDERATARPREHRARAQRRAASSARGDPHPDSDPLGARTGRCA